MRQPTVLVLTPSGGGHYYGGLVAGIGREVALAGGHVLSVLTADPSLSWVDPTARLESDLPVGSAHADVAIALMGSVSEAYLARLRDAGIPVVVVGERPQTLEVPQALPDNVGGMSEAVEHLIRHGHTRIAFIGHLDVPDVLERQEAYVATMRRHGLEVRPQDTLGSSGSTPLGGREAAQRLIAGGDLPTAIAVGTDQNAFGVLAALAEAGLRVPEDVAIVSFDAIEQSGYTTPPLTTVEQPFIEVGALAGRLAIAIASGEPVAPGAHRAAVRLITRESCGCGSRGVAVTGGARPAREHVVESLAPLLLTADVADRDALRVEAEGVLAAVDELDGAGAGVEGAAEQLMGLVHRGLSSFALRNVVRRLVSYARSEGHGEIDALDRVLWRLESACAVAEAAAYEVGIDSQAAVDNGLLGVQAADPRGLAWMAATASTFGLFAQWQEGDVRRLRVVGVHGLDEDLVGACLDPQHFPPRALVDRPRTAEHRACVVLPVKTRQHDWGALVIEGLTDLAATRETHHHWAAMLGSALEEQALKDALEVSTQRHADATRASNDGLWEWDLRSSDVWVSDRARELLGLEPDDAPSVDDLSWVHVDDRAAVATAIGKALARRDQPVQIEFRAGLREVHWLQLTVMGTARDGATVGRLVCSVGDIHQRKTLEGQLREAALFDPVTGLANRRLFLDRLDSMLAQVRRRPTRRSCAVVFMDLDGFKLVNDSLGHLHGDMLLRTVADRIRDEIRSTDTGARFGGDEFAVLLVDPSPDEVAVIVERLQRRIAEPVTIEGQEVSVTASAGITLSGAGARGSEAMLREADSAMYHAKAAERGSVAFFDHTMHAEATERLRLQHELRVALNEEQFVVHYQPIVPLDGGQVRRYEALVRWQHPTKGLLLPAEFLPVLDAGAGIVELGTWVLEQTCEQLAAWAADGESASVAVNLAHREFWNPALVDNVSKALARHGLPPESLVLEITETVMLTDVDAARDVMNRLHGLGVRLSVDDFGTGQSSLHTLRSFAVDVLKIDGAFVRGMEDDPQLAELVTVILELGRALGLEVVAECVETAAQEHLLRAMGCANVQGWRYGRAVPGDDAGHLLGLSLDDVQVIASQEAGVSPWV